MHFANAVPTFGRHRAQPMVALFALAAVGLLSAGAPLAGGKNLHAQIVRIPGAPLPVRRAVDDYEPDTTRRSGPRFGLVYLGGALPDSVAAHHPQHSGRLITLFGWEIQRQIGKNPGGPQPLTDLLFAVGGLEHGVLLPSASWIIGIRMPNQFEFGVGPNLSAAGAALVVTAGTTRHLGTINMPFDVAVVPSAIGTRVSVTTGFNVGR